MKITQTTKYKTRNENNTNNKTVVQNTQTTLLKITQTTKYNIENKI